MRSTLSAPPRPASPLWPDLDSLPGRGAPPRAPAPQRWRLPMALAATICLLAALAGGIAYRQSHGAHAMTGVPPMIYGTNMSLFDTHDQIVNNASTQQLLKQMGMPIIRMPYRRNLSDDTEMQALRAIKSIGAAPLVIVQGATDANALADDLRQISVIQQVFGASTVYIEFGNEEDLAGVDVARYTTAWNAIVPRLKAQAPSYKFIGPVNFQYNPTYIATFDRAASPRPDFNSWHEYVCNTGNPDSYCMAHIANWATHVQATNSAVRAAIGTTLPFMITEWNLDPNQDPRYGNAAFIQAWMASALRMLAAQASSGLVAAMQYCATNNQGFNLIDGNAHLTPQGQTLAQQLAQAASDGQASGATPAPPVAPTSAPTLTPPSQPTAPASIAPPATAAPESGPGVAATAYSFETGADGWAAHGAQITSLSSSTAYARAGTHALQIGFTSLTGSTYPYLAVAPGQPPAGMHTLSLAIYVPAGMGSVLARPFSMDQTYRWVGDDDYIALAPGWNIVTHTLPAGYAAPLRQIGVQFMARPGATLTGSLYLDAVGWAAP